MKLIKKAFTVWHEGMLNQNPELGYYEVEEIPVVYADSPTEAKTIAKEPYDFNIHDTYMAGGRKPTFIDLKVRRAPEADKVLFEGREITRREAVIGMLIMQKIKIRNEKISKYPDDTCFYIQNGYVGNCVAWHGKNGSGYPCDITKAQLFTKAEVLAHKWRDEDRIWESKHVLANLKYHVDSQYLNSEFVS